MSALAGAARLDLRLQRRYGLLQAGLVMAALWVLLLRLLPEAGRAVAAPLVVFGDLAVVGYFFVGGLVLFEKAEGTFAALAVSPVRAGHYLAARVASMTLLALLLTAVVVAAGHGLSGLDPLLLLVGVLLCSATSVLVGLAVVAPFASVARYLIPAVLPLIVLGLPLLHAPGWLPPAVVVLLPTGGAWLAVDAAFASTQDLWLAAGVVIGAGWAAAAAWVARRQYMRHLARAGT